MTIRIKSKDNEKITEICELLKISRIRYYLEASLLAFKIIKTIKSKEKEILEDSTLNKQ